MESQVLTQIGVGLVAVLAIGGLVVGGVKLRRKKNPASEAAGTNGASAAKVEPQSPRAAPRDQDAIYQGGRIVARVLDAEVDEEAEQVRFGKVYNSDELLLPDECEFQKHRIVIQTIAFASKVEQTALPKGRILRGVTADILGYREQ